MGDEFINCPLLSSAVLVVIAHLWSSTKKEKKNFFWKTFLTSQCPLLSSTLCCFSFPPPPSVSPPSFSSRPSSPSLLVLPRGPWCSSNGLSLRGGENYSIYVYIETSSQHLALLFWLLFPSWNTSLMPKDEGSMGADSLLLPPPPLPSTVPSLPLIPLSQDHSQ